MMDLRLIYAIILSILPISELRGAFIFLSAQGMVKISNSPIFFLIILTNICAVFIAFFFLDHIHLVFMKNRFYRKIFESYISRFQKKTDKFEKRYSAIGFLALTLFVAIPLPVTGAWSGCLLSWLLDLDRKKSIISIIAGVIIAGMLMLLGMLGFLSLFS